VANDGTLQDITTCDFSNLHCSVFMQSLNQAPYSLEKGQAVIIKAVGFNSAG
jgi:hypothetical protein